MVPPVDAFRDCLPHPAGTSFKVWDAQKIGWLTATLSTLSRDSWFRVFSLSMRLEIMDSNT
jgi:hypothetical protein